MDRKVMAIGGGAIALTGVIMMLRGKTAGGTPSGPHNLILEVLEDGTNVPLSVSVQVNGKASGETDDSGILMLSLKAGTYDLTFTKTGYEPQACLGYPMGETDNYNRIYMVLEGSGLTAALHGEITDIETGWGIFGVYVATSNKSTNTNSEGIYRLTGLETGVAKLVVSKEPEYITQRLDITLVEETIVDIQMERDTTNNPPPGSGYAPISPVRHAQDKWCDKLWVIYQETLAEYGPSNVLARGDLARYNNCNSILKQIEEAISVGYSHILVDDMRRGYQNPFIPLEFQKKEVGWQEVIWDYPSCPTAIIDTNTTTLEIPAEQYYPYPTLAAIYLNTEDLTIGSNGWLVFNPNWAEIARQNREQDTMNTLKQLIQGYTYWIGVYL